MNGSEEHKLDELKRLLRRLERLEEATLPPPRPLLALPAALPRTPNADPAAVGLSELRTGKPAGEPRLKIEPGDKSIPPPSAKDAQSGAEAPEPITMQSVVAASVAIGQSNAARVAPTQRMKGEPVSGSGSSVPAKPLIAVERTESSAAKQAGDGGQDTEKPAEKASLSEVKPTEMGVSPPVDVTVTSVTAVGASAAGNVAGLDPPSTLAGEKESPAPQSSASSASATSSQTAPENVNTERPTGLGTSTPPIKAETAPPTKTEAASDKSGEDAGATESPVALTGAPAEKEKKKEEAQEQREAGKPETKAAKAIADNSANVALPALRAKGNAPPGKTITAVSPARANKRILSIVAASCGVALVALVLFIVVQKGTHRPPPGEAKPEPVVATAESPAAVSVPSAKADSTESTVRKPSVAAEPLVPAPAAAEPPARTETAREAATRPEGAKTAEVAATAPGEASVATASSRTETPPVAPTQETSATIANSGALDRRPQEAPPDKPTSTETAQPETDKAASGEPGKSETMDAATASRSADARGGEPAKAESTPAQADGSNVAAATPPPSARAATDQSNAAPPASREVGGPVVPTRDGDASLTPSPVAVASTNSGQPAPVEALKSKGLSEANKPSSTAESRSSDSTSAPEARSAPASEQTAPVEGSRTPAAQPAAPAGPAPEIPAVSRQAEPMLPPRSPSPTDAQTNAEPANPSTAQASAANRHSWPTASAVTDARKTAEPAPASAATPALAADPPPTVVAVVPVPAPPPAAPEEPRKRLLAAPETWVVPAGARRPLPLVFNPPTSSEGYRLLISGIEDDATVAGGTEIVAGTWMVEGTRLGQAQLERGEKPPARLRLALELRAADGAALARHSMTLLTSPDGAH